MPRKCFQHGVEAEVLHYVSAPQPIEWQGSIWDVWDGSQSQKGGEEISGSSSWVALFQDSEDHFVDPAIIEEVHFLRPPRQSQVCSHEGFVAASLLLFDGYEKHIWMFQKIGVPPNHRYISIWFSIVNHPLWDTPIFGNTHMFAYPHRNLRPLFLCFFSTWILLLHDRWWSSIISVKLGRYP